MRAGGRSPRLREGGAALLRPFAVALLSRNAGAGALALLAVAAQPRVATLALAAVVVAQGVTWGAGLGREAVREGVGACAALLATLALASLHAVPSWGLVVAVGVVAVAVTAATQALLGRALLPALSIPFVLTTWLLLLALRVVPAGAADGALAWMPERLWGGVAGGATGAAGVPAALLYLEGAIPGALVLLAIGWHSRLALGLALLGGAGALLLRALFRPAVLWSDIDTVAAFNAMLSAMALGGTWFVPQRSSLVLAVAGAMGTALVSWALIPVTGTLGLPVLSLPFALVTLAVLLGARLREADRRPTSTVPAARPEDALAAHRMRVRRFGEVAWLPFRLPFRGTWAVTQGTDGAHTHTGRWRHGVDFERMGSDGRPHEGEGTAVSDYLCYGVPVLAAGGGVVEQVVDGIPDNPVGGVNARANWGNVVVIAHGAQLYSVYAHLQPGSVAVRPGERVRAGAEVGRCGNSGRSLVPHLHFHLQRGAALGSDTLPADFGDVVMEGTAGAPAVVAQRVHPPEGASVRPVQRDEALAEALAFPVGRRWQLTEVGGARTEEAVVEVDLASRVVLRSNSGALYLECYDAGVVVMGFDGDPGSLLRPLAVALARVPFDQAPVLAWEDRAPRWVDGGRVVAAVRELAGVLSPAWTDMAMRYVARRQAGAVVVAGEAVTAGWRTEAVVALDDRAHRITVRRGDGSVVRALTMAPVRDAFPEET